MEKNNKQKWEESVNKAIKRFPERKKPFKTSSDIEVKRLYYPETNEEYEEKLGFPGEFPYTRGIQPTMYRSRLWTMRQYAGFGSAKETNSRFKYLLEQGQTGDRKSTRLNSSHV